MIIDLARYSANNEQNQQGKKSNKTKPREYILLTKPKTLGLVVNQKFGKAQFIRVECSQVPENSLKLL